MREARCHNPRDRYHGAPMMQRTRWNYVGFGSAVWIGVSACGQGTHTGDTGTTDASSGEVAAEVAPDGIGDSAEDSGPAETATDTSTATGIDSGPEGEVVVALRVDERDQTLGRDPRIVGIPVPFGRALDLTSVADLSVFDAEGTPLPTQLEVLSRWDGRPDDASRPIRWAYAWVGAVPTAGTAAAWTLRASAVGAPATGDLGISESASAWVIDTGAARFTIDRVTFKGLSKVEVPVAGGGFATASDAGADGGFFVTHEGVGVTSTRTLAPWRLALERSGPVLATVVARGFYAAPGVGTRDLGYTVRLHFVRGSGVVRIEHTYYHGAVAGWGADGAANATRIARAWLRIPITGASALHARADTTVHDASPSGSVRLEQLKRTPSAADLRFELAIGTAVVESGALAKHPVLSVATPRATVSATIARMAVRDPQALRWDPAGALDLDFTSAPMQVGGARGIWSVATVDFASPGASATLRGDVLQRAAEAPLIGAPEVGWLNASNAIGPYATATIPRYAPLFDRLANLHARTNEYLARARITGLQLWPDLPRASCDAEFTCDTVLGAYFEGGDDNYWNWSKPGLDAFFRTAQGFWAHDVSIAEATTFAETLAFRVDHDRLDDSSVTGLAPCYGSGRGWSDDWQEGLNHRRDNCPADYSYNKTLRFAYLATADRRFVDYFEEVGEAVATTFGDPPPTDPQPYLELSVFRLAEQRLEFLADGAEFAQTPAVSDRLRRILRADVDFMLGRSLIGGHACDTSSTGTSDAKTLGTCIAPQAWMMPTVLDWAVRVGRYLDHAGLLQWVRDFGIHAARHYTVLDVSGLPDDTAMDASSADNAANGWRTEFTCDANAGGIDEASCTKATGGENANRFYPDGALALLNVFGLVLGSDPADPDRICDWLPDAYQRAFERLGDGDINARIWGKASGQAFAFSPEALGALERCAAPPSNP